MLVVLAVVVLVVSAPLRRAAQDEETEDAERAELEAARDAKYREIRDAELDHAAGKLSDEDYAALDAELRDEALEILDGSGNGNGNGSHPREPEKLERS